MMEVSKKVNERLTEIHRALDILRKEGASSGDVDNMLEELEYKIIQEEMFPFLREAVGPALSPLRHRLSLVVDYMPGAPLNIRIDKNFTPDVLPADVQERHEDDGMDGNEDLDVSGIFMCEKCAQEEGRGKVPVAMEDMDDNNCFTVRKENGELVLDMPPMYGMAKANHQNTLSSTVRAIVEFQKDFFMTGRISTLKPMTLNDIEERTGLDKSTVSRAVNGKEIITEYGRYSLKYFFSEGIEKAGGRVSWRVLEEDIKNIIAGEDKNSPLTDDGMVEILADKGYAIARRTVAKYRMQLGIPVARERKDD